jgi:proline dehydrogenase
MRRLVLTMANSRLARTVFSGPLGRPFARRFVAGESLEDAIGVARILDCNGRRVSLDYLGEAVASLEEAEAAAEVYRQTIDSLCVFQRRPTVSVKPTQFGLALSPDRCLQLLDSIAEVAGAASTGVRLDMEDSRYTDLTLDLWHELHRKHPNVGVVLQASLYRTPSDLARVLSEGGSVRLCKGAYAERSSIAHPRKADVDRAYRILLHRLMAHAAESSAPDPGMLPIAAIATHDSRLIKEAIDLVRQLGVGSDRYEFQFLFGVRRDLQERLVKEGYPVRVYVPWGPAWYPYLSRRLAERPANVVFFLSALLSEARLGLSQPSHSRAVLSTRH